MKLKDLLYAKFEHEQNNRGHERQIKIIESAVLAAVQEKSQKKKTLPLWIPIATGFAIVIILLAVVNALYFKNTQSPVITKKTPTPIIIKKSPTEIPTKITGAQRISPTPVRRVPANVTLASGYKFNLPEAWSSRIFNESKEHFAGRFFIPGTNGTSSYIDIESIDSSRSTPNPFITQEKASQKKINGIATTVVEGRENFQRSNRRVQQATFNVQNKLLMITAYYTGQATIEEQFDQLVASVQTEKPFSWWKTFFIKGVHATEAIAGFEKEKYQRIEVMAAPIIVRLTKEDVAYKNGYAKLYTFDAFKGQRLTTVAEEDRASNSGSFIRSELYDETGQGLLSRDTRLEFEAPYTGKYYLIARSFNSQEGSFKLKIFDRNQTENLSYLKYADGREVLIDYNKRPPQYGAEEAALIMQFISPVEVIEHSVKFQAKPKEFETDPGVITVPVQLYAKPGSYQDDILGGTHLPEDSQSNLQKIKITSLTPSKLLIEPEMGGLFPKNYHYRLMLYVPVSGGAASYGGGRFFLENSQ